MFKCKLKIFSNISIQGQIFCQETVGIQGQNIILLMQCFLFFKSYVPALPK